MAQGPRAAPEFLAALCRNAASQTGGRPSPRVARRRMRGRSTHGLAVWPCRSGLPASSLLACGFVEQVLEHAWPVSSRDVARWPSNLMLVVLCLCHRMCRGVPACRAECCSEQYPSGKGCSPPPCGAVFAAGTALGDRLLGVRLLRGNGRGGLAWAAGAGCPRRPRRPAERPCVVVRLAFPPKRTAVAVLAHAFTCAVSAREARNPRQHRGLSAERIEVRGASYGSDSRSDRRHVEWQGASADVGEWRAPLTVRVGEWSSPLTYGLRVEVSTHVGCGEWRSPLTYRS